MNSNEMPYNLESGKDSSQFYENLNIACDLVINTANDKLDDLIKDYMVFIRVGKIEPLRSHDEYLIEAISIGVFWKNYLGGALKLNRSIADFLHYLYNLRRRNKKLKPYVDKVRGYLFSRFLESETESGQPKSTGNFESLVAWLKSSGDFREECERLDNWLHFFTIQSDSNARKWISTIVSYASTFEDIGKTMLGKYTSKVDSFRNNNYSSYKNREDLILCFRPENEYHLNMIAAVILNREFQEKFERTEQKILLLPTCMRTMPESHCKASPKGRELICASCSVNCRINNIKSKMNNEGIEVRLIPHSSDFSEFLKTWENSETTGLIGVACVLNLLTGGYEMKKLNIPSQCVFLESCGCKNHWDREGIPTELNLRQVLQIAQPKKMKLSA